MNKLVTICLIMLLIVVSNANIFAATTQIDELQPLGIYDVTHISFDYTYGGNADEDEFQIKGYYDGSGHWAMDVNFDESGSPLYIDTDYGPYVVDGALGAYIGTHNYDFMLNSYTGLWTLAIDGTPMDFVAIEGTNSVQPDGTAVTEGNVVANKYYSDESTQAGLNAVDLGWATWNGSDLEGNASDGVGGVKQYRLRFYLEDAEGCDGDSYGTITTTNVPEPGTLALIVFGVLSLLLIRKQR